ncbi:MULTISPECIES: ABC transporter permease [Halorhodospira]|uniref:ABC transporter permease n=1 Tax=Halorhodospira TaxID=85108 RepID=UPI001EE8B22D|nr:MULTISPECIES: ABC transporter permease [Halorhodospira]MCG5528995.1 ABC transporter permease [Halorhodospira halophila]MCG5544093.1 ABC transporter permease [Halorhodospira sp. 9628]
MSERVEIASEEADPPSERDRWLPRPSVRFIPVWRRNFRVWRRLIWPSLLGHFGEPVLYLLAFGYGLGALIGDLDSGMPYIVFIASGIVCSSAMFTSSFEALYSAYTRMETQQTWAAMLGAPLSVDDIVLGEAVWAASKSLLSAGAIGIVAVALGILSLPGMLLALPVVFLAALAFASMALIITALSPSYDFFLYYFTLVLTPMLLLSGVFFPIEQLPALVAGLAYLLPLAHMVEVVRPLAVGEGLAPGALLHLLVPLGYIAAAFTVASYLFRRRLIR